MIDERPDPAALAQRPREVATQAYDVLARGNVFGNSQHILDALRVSRFSLLDSVYACQLSADQRLLFTANRGLNHITHLRLSVEHHLRLRAPDARHPGVRAEPVADGRSPAGVPSRGAGRLSLPAARPTASTVLRKFCGMMVPINISTASEAGLRQAMGMVDRAAGSISSWPSKTARVPRPPMAGSKRVVPWQSMACAMKKGSIRQVQSAQVRRPLRVIQPAEHVAA